MKEINSVTKKQYKRWSKSIRKDDYTKEISVEEIENGFIISMSEYGTKNGKYSDDTKKFYSKTNPLSDEDIEKDNGLDTAIESFLESM